jgi:hypothetical protein
VDFLQNNAEQRENFKTAITGRENILMSNKGRLAVYYWALQYLSVSGAAVPGSAEATLVDRRISQAMRVLIKQGVTEEDLDLRKLSAGALADEPAAFANLGAKEETPEVALAKAEARSRQLTATLIRAKINDAVEWKCGLPVLKDVEKWLPTGAAAVNQS